MKTTKKQMVALFAEAIKDSKIIIGNGRHDVYDAFYSFQSSLGIKATNMHTAFNIVKLLEKEGV